MSKELLTIGIDVKSEGLQLCPITVNADYKREWNESCSDFICLTFNGELLRETLYRIGGIGRPNLKEDQYFLLLKYVEAYYPADILRMSGTKDPKHLDGIWCIMDKYGAEKVVLEKFKTPYLVKNSCLYSIDQNYYNIETGEFYCKSYTSIQSNDYLFLDNAYDQDKTRRGVMKIHKKTGEWELFQTA